MAFSITSANAVFLLGVVSAYPTPVQLQGFGVDDAFTTSVVAASEVQVGVDGVGVAGYVPRSPTMTIRLLASSNSLVIFENWVAAMDTLQDILLANAQITLPALGRKYTCYQGALLDVSTLADARKVLANREFRIQWLPGQTPGVPAITVAPS